MELKKLSEIINEVKVTKNHAVKYFKMVKKAIGAKNYELSNKDSVTGTVTVTFKDSKLLGSDLTVLLSSDNRLFAYSLDNGDTPFRMLPKSFTSFKDIINDAKLFKTSKTKAINIKQASNSKEVGIEMPSGENALPSFDFENEKYGAVKEGNLYRIYAKKDFGDVKKGDKGGLINQESNLSRKGNCWVYKDAKVYGKAKVYGDAKVFDNAQVYMEAHVYDEAHVYGKAEVYGKVKVYGEAEVFDNAQVYDDAKVFGGAQVYDDAKVHGQSEVYGEAHVYGKARVYGTMKKY